MPGTFQEGAFKLAKRFLILLFLVALAGAGYAAVSSYLASHRSPESVAESFMNNLAKGEAEATYKQFSSALQKQRSPQDWQSYVRSLGQTGQPPSFVRKSDITDRFNTYPSGSEPQRFTYMLQVKSRDYQAVAVILKQDGAWKIDDFQGDYK